MIKREELTNPDSCMSQVWNQPASLKLQSPKAIEALGRVLKIWGWSQAAEATERIRRSVA